MFLLLGSDDNSGAANSPFKSLHRAQEAVRKRKESSGPIKVLVREGTYYLQRPLRFLSEDSGKRDEQVVYSGYPGERVTISGGRNLSCNWIPYKDGVMMTPVLSGLEFTQLFVNGKRQIRARYPNYDPSDPGKSGYLQATGPIPADAKNPHAGPDDDMTYSTQAPRGILFDPTTFTKGGGRTQGKQRFTSFKRLIARGDTSMEDQEYRLWQAIQSGFGSKGWSTDRRQVEQ